MVSPLSPLMLQGQQVDLTGSLLAGRDAYQQSQLNNQAMQSNQQQIARADYEQGVERLKLINRLAMKVKELPPEQRGGFVNSLNQDMLRSVGIDPAQISSVQLDDQSLDALIAQTGAAIPEGSQYRKESVSTNQGLMVFDPSTGSYAPAKGQDGKPLSAAQYDPSLQGQISTAKQTGQNVSDLQLKPEITRATTMAKTEVENAAAAADRQAKSREEGASALPKLEAQADNSIRLIDELLAHPGRDIATGSTSWVPAIPGTKQSDFINRFDQIKGQAFLQAFESLKGGGAITEIEGKAATQAINRLNRATTKQEFDAAANDLKKVLQDAKAVAKKKAGLDSEPSLDDLLSKYGD